MRYCFIVPSASRSFSLGIPDLRLSSARSLSPDFGPCPKPVAGRREPSKGNSDPFTLKYAESCDTFGTTGPVSDTDSDTLVTPGLVSSTGADAPVKSGPVLGTESAALPRPDPVSGTGSALLAEGKTLGASPKKK